MPATNFTVKDPNCLQVVITPLSNTAGAVGAVIGQQQLGSLFQSSRILSQRIVLRGVFSEDGDSARLESTTDEEDSYIESADGSVCIKTTSQRNKKLVLNINSCTDAVTALIQMKQNRGFGSNLNISALHIVVSDLCTGRRIESESAWMLSNPGESLGGFSEDGEEITFLLSNIKDNQAGVTNSLAVFNGTNLPNQVFNI